jgi:LAS superfamily LD-carboxypeptidase LdcB
LVVLEKPAPAGFFVSHACGYNSAMLNELELTGRANTHVEQHDELGASVHRDILDPYLALKAAAAIDGIELRIVSGFRDFAAQLRIWNAKYRGERPLYDAAGNPRDYADLDVAQRVSAILCWSALPGASRHHWGTDIDVIDGAAMPDDYRYRLLPQEYEAGGIFHPLNLWLERNIARFGFFRPYAEFRGGTFPEPWHLSHAPLATAALEALTEPLLAETLHASDIQGKEHVLANLRDIHRRYIRNIAPSPIAA